MFIIANALLMYQGFFYLPLTALVPAVIYLAFFSLNSLFMTVVFFTPLSVELSRFVSGYPFDISIPTEPLIIVIMLVVLLRLFHKCSVDREMLFHPLSLAVLFYLLWLFITALTSTMPMVSAKFFLVRLWFILIFYFLAIKIFSRHRNIRVFLWCYILAMIPVIIYTLYSHAGYGYISQKAAPWVVRPFFNDHTAYGASLAMFIPVLTAFAFMGISSSAGLIKNSIIPEVLVRKLKSRLPELSNKIMGAVNFRWIIWVLILFFTGALVLSFSRAAWLSILAALFIWFIIKLRIGFVPLISFTLVTALLIFVTRADVVREMEKNTQDSSADFREHIRSITNISSDASNLERINRWKAAMAMFDEKPIFGWGPGTYMFTYAPFQYSYDRTIISTNFGDGGDAHSEYLGPLSETGLPGMLSFMVIAVLALITGFRLLKELDKRKDKILVTGVLLGLVTYLVHGTLNNFLHSDKAAIPFWGFIAILVAMDLYRKKTTLNKENL